MRKERILVIEDDRHVLELLKLCLKQEDFSVTTAEDGEAGLNLALNNTFDLIILDIMLPNKTGWEICRALTGVRKSWVPILILTAKTQENDRILGLEMGADDYVMKPFSPRELIARVRNILRRVSEKSSNANPSNIIEFPGLKIDILKHLVEVNGVSLTLTPKEFELLHFLALNSTQVFSRQQILENIWGYDYMDSTRTVDEHIKKLRGKLTGTRHPYTYIHTIWGIGYKFEVRE